MRGMRVLDEDQARAFLRAARTDRLYALWVLALTTGLRRGELLGLCWQDLDLEGGRLTVRRALLVVNGRYILSAPKTQSAYRTIALPGVAISALREWRTRQIEERLQAGAQWQSTVSPSDPPELRELVFTSRRGAPAGVRSLRRAFMRILSAAGLPPMRLHDLRHSAATLMLAGGVDARTASEVLGHSDPSITLGVYSHVVESMRRRAASVMDTIMGGATPTTPATGTTGTTGATGATGAADGRM